MKLSVKESSKPLVSTELVAVFGLQGEDVRLPRGVRVVEGARASFRGEFREARVTDALAGPAKRVLFVGLGKKADVELDRLRRAAALAVKQAEKAKHASLALWVDPALASLAGGPGALAQALAEGAVMGSYTFQRFKSRPKGPNLKTLALHGSGGVEFKRGTDRGRVVGEANLLARELQDTPANRMRPRDLLAAARKVAAQSPRIACRALDENALQRQKMGALLSVAKGSEEPAYLIHLSYQPRGRAREKLCFIGKGLTFDAGGISLKPAAKMDEMKFDMSGGAAVIGVFQGLASIDVPFEIHGLVPATENLPDGRANKPGDLVEAFDGTTIEVLNTDAEGRLVLADALAYAKKKLEPDLIVDLATLTGAVVTALGHELSGVMGNEQGLIDELVAAGKATGELVWPLPLLEQHKDHMKGALGDLKNINAGQGAGASAGAAFLAHFVGTTPWAHLDIAGSAWGADDRDYQGGAWGTGVGVRLLLKFLEERAR